MAVKLRLMRMGKTKQPTYRIVAADRRSPRNGRFIETLGTYQPRLNPSGLKVDNARCVVWLREGAQPSERVAKLLAISGAWAHFENGTTPEPGEGLGPDIAEVPGEPADPGTRQGQAFAEGRTTVDPTAAAGASSES